MIYVLDLLFFIFLCFAARFICTNIEGSGDKEGSSQLPSHWIEVQL